MLLADIFEHVRTVVDLDDIELSDTFLETVVREGNDNIIARSRVWPDFEQHWTFNTVANTQTYTIGSIEPADTDTAEILTIIDSTQGGFPLEPVQHGIAEQVWRNTLNVPGIPTHWSLWAGSIYLWRKPDSVRTLNVRSYRRQNDWLTNDDPIDMDSRLHPALALYALARVYAFQEEPVWSAQYEQMFERHVARMMQEIFRNPQTQMVLNRGVSKRRLGHGMIVGPAGVSVL